MSGAEYLVSAAKGAAIARREKEEEQAQELEYDRRLKAAWERTRPLQNAVVRLSQVEGVEITFSPQDYRPRVKATLVAGNCSYTVMIDEGERGYSIHRRRHRNQTPRSERDYEEYEGSNKMLEEALDAIAMIVGYHFPEQAEAIDQTIADAKAPAGIQPAGPSGMS